MKKSIFKQAISKIFYTLLIVLLLNIIISKNLICLNAKDIVSETKKIEANYKEEISFSRKTWIKFPDFDLIFLGTGVYTGGGRYIPITFYYFRLVNGNKDTIIYWSSGTGDIAPIPFEFNGNDFLIEIKQRYKLYISRRNKLK